MRLQPVLTQLDGIYEVLFVDDGSNDRSASMLSVACQGNPNYRLIRLGRNFGHQIAISAGMDLAQGDATIIMDADLQDPPEVVLQMIAEWKKGFELVYGKRLQRDGETIFKRVTAFLFYRTLGYLSEIQIPVDVGDFRLIDRAALLAFRSMREHHRYVRGMFAWVGFSQTAVEFVRPQRFAGVTKYPFRKMIALAKDGLLGFSTKPLRLALKLGFMTSGLASLYALYAIGLKLTGRFVVTGWTSMAVMVTFLGGVQLIVLGILGEYIGRIHEEVKGRPLYIVKELHGFRGKLIPESHALFVGQAEGILRAHSQ